MTDVIEKARSLITPALLFHTDIVADRAEGIYVYATDGKRYMDFSSGLAVLNVGHCHPSVVRAIEEQAHRLIHSGCIFHYSALVELAERLKEITPRSIDMFFFSNSGAEAVEGAIKLARYATQRQAIIAFVGGFHGRTFGAVSLTTSSARYRRNYHPLLPSVFHAPYPYCYRCPMGRRAGDCSLECLSYVEWMFEHIVTPEEVACVIIEPVLGEGGYVVPPQEYMAGLREITEKQEILFISDEVQTGFGRTGSWFASQHFGIEPDIIVLAKAIAGGLPLSAVGGRKELMERWKPGAHGTTFGGNPVSARASLEVINIIEKEGLLENVRTVGEYALEELGRLKSRYPCIGDVRGLGFMLGIEFVRADGSPDPDLLERVMDGCIERGLIIVECGTHKNIARLMPPLMTSREEMQQAISILEEAIEASI